jgi:hypothetical protein
VAAAGTTNELAKAGILAALAARQAELATLQAAAGKGSACSSPASAWPSVHATLCEKANGAKAKATAGKATAEARLQAFTGYLAAIRADIDAKEKAFLEHYLQGQSEWEVRAQQRAARDAEACSLTQAKIDAHPAEGTVDAPMAASPAAPPLAPLDEQEREANRFWQVTLDLLPPLAGPQAPAPTQEETDAMGRLWNVVTPILESRAIVTFGQVGVDIAFAHKVLGHVHWKRCYQDRTVDADTVVNWILANTLLTVLNAVGAKIRERPSHAAESVRAEATVKQLDSERRRKVARTRDVPGDAQAPAAPAQ